MGLSTQDSIKLLLEFVDSCDEQELIDNHYFSEDEIKHIDLLEKVRAKLQVKFNNLVADISNLWGDARIVREEDIDEGDKLIN